MGLWIYSREHFTREQLVSIGELHEKYRKRVWNTGWYFYIVISGGPASNVYATIHQKIYSISRVGSMYRLKENFKLLNILDDLIDMKLTELGI